LGYHGALGLRAVDWKVTDRVADLPAHAWGQLEVALPLSVCVLPLRPYTAPVPRWSRAELGIAADAVVAATFVGVQKLSPRCLALWRAWLDAVPQGRLLFSPPRADDRTAIERRCAGFGIDGARRHFVPYLRDDAAALHARYALADMALDTMPYTGGDTTAAALAAGVPVVTRTGTRHAERMSASILLHAGLPELVAADDDAYVALATRLATERTWREAQRAAVVVALRRPALTDPAVYARALEDAYTRALSERHLLPT
jgi:predicted O-linked N-acetylglucosamine transferase (SPINDLY family)